MSVIVGLSIILGVLCILAIILVFIGLYTSRARTNDLEAEMNRRLESLRERHMLEQRQWRERRLRQVVLLLIERGEAEEGIPMAFQISGHAEVLARRRVHTLHPDQRSLMHERIDEELFSGITDTQHVRAMKRILCKTLEELLDAGRPEEAEAAPDVMQMLLDGQEGMTRLLTSSDDEDSSNFETEDGSDPVTSDLTPVATNPGASAHSMLLNPLTEHTTVRSVQPQGNSEAQQSPGSAARAAVTPSESVTPRYDQLDPRGRQRADRLIRRLRNERDTRRKRRPAEELYGFGIPYIPNPSNAALLLKENQSPLLGDTHRQPSMFERFLSPLTPFRSRRRFRSATGGAVGTGGGEQQGRSAFEDRAPGQECDASSRHGSPSATQPAPPHISANRKSSAHNGTQVGNTTFTEPF